MSESRPVEGNFTPDGARFAIVVARWNGGRADIPAHYNPDIRK
jgi:6,7-dimethyl-8-ribityllumazine synthase